MKKLIAPLKGPRKHEPNCPDANKYIPKSIGHNCTDPTLHVHGTPEHPILCREKHE